LTGEDIEQNLARAQQAFSRAFELNPELSLAHNLHTNLEVELGRAEDAMLRLLERARGRPGDAELLAGLVQACPYCGLREPAIAAYEQAHHLDRNIWTSVNHAYPDARRLRALDRDLRREPADRERHRARPVGTDGRGHRSAAAARTGRGGWHRAD